MNTREQLIDALHTFVSKRPGFDYQNYGSWSSYHADVRMVGKDRNIAHQLLRDIQNRTGITVEDILKAAQGSRVEIAQTEKGWSVSYCAGQYYCVEYRAAIARLAACVLRTYVRANYLPKPETDGGMVRYGGAKSKIVSSGDWMREYFLRRYGRGIASQYFD